MNISQEKKDQIQLLFGDDLLDTLLRQLNNETEKEFHHLCLFLGVYLPDKKKALASIADATGLSVQHLSMNDFVFRSEAETKENLNAVFQKYDAADTLLHFSNGDKLCGAYTGFTHSRVKYASPQERHFLQLVKEFKGLVIVDISEYTAADKSIRRAAQSIIHFDLPNSILQRFMWHLKNYSLHGFQLKTKRPDSYGEVPANF